MKNSLKLLPLLLLCLLSLLACDFVSLPYAEEPEEETTPPTTIRPVTKTPSGVTYGAIARQHLAALCEEIGPRLPGSAEEAEAAEYIQAAFKSYGYNPQMQRFAFTNDDDEELESANVIAVKRGVSSEAIIVGAHYDSVDDGNGADDNAAGVAALLEVARLLQDAQTPYTIHFVAFGAEEADMDGSHYYVEQMSKADIKNTVAMINLDSLIAGDIAYVYGDAGRGSLRDWIIQAAADAGFDLQARTAKQLDYPDGTPCDCADYDAFQEAGIPFAFFEATNWDLSPDAMTQVDPDLGEDGVIRHTEYDTLDYIDATFPGRIDKHLNVFITLLYDALTQFTISD